MESTKYVFLLLFWSGNGEITSKLQSDDDYLKKNENWLTNKNRTHLWGGSSETLLIEMAFCPLIVLKNTSNFKPILYTLKWLK